jgi:hypothetical protein
LLVHQALYSENVKFTIKETESCPSLERWCILALNFKNCQITVLKFTEVAEEYCLLWCDAV